VDRTMQDGPLRRRARVSLHVRDGRLTGVSERPQVAHERGGVDDVGIQSLPAPRAEVPELGWSWQASPASVLGNIPGLALAPVLPPDHAPAQAVAHPSPS